MTDEELRRLFEETRQQIVASAAETRRYVDQSVNQSAAETRQYIDQSVTQSAQETRQYIDQSVTQSAQETRRYVDQSVTQSSDELRRHFDVHGEYVRTNFDSFAEGLVLLDEKLERLTSDLRDEMRRGFAETHAMIRFSYGELDRRVIVLEDWHRNF